MAKLQILQLLQKAGPTAAKQLPKLWPLLLESKNREKLGHAVRDLASQSPTKRLRARAVLTASLADKAARETKDEAMRARAEEWSRRAGNLALLLDMPVQGRKPRSDHRLAVRTQLDELQAEMRTVLTS